MAGISSKALKGNYAENKRKYNGIKYDDDLDLDTYEAYYRNLDPQTGRWWKIDPKIDEGYESVSPYASMYDDPIRYSDPLGDEGEACCKQLWEDVKDFGGRVWDAAIYDAKQVNIYVNPLTPAVELATGKSVDSDFKEDKPRDQSALELGITLLPGGKVEVGIEKDYPKRLSEMEKRLPRGQLRKEFQKPNRRLQRVKSLMDKAIQKVLQKENLLGRQRIKMGYPGVSSQPQQLLYVREELINL